MKQFILLIDAVTKKHIIINSKFIRSIEDIYDEQNNFKFSKIAFIDGRADEFVTDKCNVIYSQYFIS